MRIEPYPILKLIDIVMFGAFVVFALWLAYWAYMDTCVRQANGQNTLSFPKKLALGVVFNVIVYSIILATITYYILEN